MHICRSTHRGLKAASAGFVVAACSAASSARADVASQLQCNIAGARGFIVSSTRAESCTFQSLNGPVQFYNGTISRVGLNVGMLTAGCLTYQVLALGTPQPGILQGKYVGSGAGIILGTGVGVDALVGGSGSGISLQPIALGHAGDQQRSRLWALQNDLRRPRRAPDDAPSLPFPPSRRLIASPTVSMMRRLF